MRPAALAFWLACAPAWAGPPDKSGDDAAAAARARRVEGDRRADEEILKRGMIFRSQQDRVNWQRCKMGVKEVCSKIRYERAPGLAPIDPRTGRRRPPKSDGEAGESGGVEGEGREGDGEQEKKEEDTGATSTPEASAKAQAAVTRATAIGEKLKEQLSDGALAGAAGDGGPAGLGAKAAAGGPAPSRAPAPRSEPPEGDKAAEPENLDLAAAAASGFSASFSAAGLKMGSGASAGRVVREDGRPAAPEDLERLRAQIAADPKALMRRPDFFDVVGRDRFDGLKTALKTKPQAGALKHIGLTQDERDIVYKQSCTKLDKHCNPAAALPYKKGDFVTPEDLMAIDEALEAGEEDEIAEAEASEGLPGAGQRAGLRTRRRGRSAPSAAAGTEGAEFLASGGKADVPFHRRPQAAHPGRGAPSRAPEPAQSAPLWPAAAVAGLAALWFFRRG